MIIRYSIFFYLMLYCQISFGQVKLDVDSNTVDAKENFYPVYSYRKESEIKSLDKNKNLGEFRRGIASDLKSLYNLGYYDSKFILDTFYILKETMYIRYHVDTGFRYRITSIRLKSKDKGLDLPFIYKMALRNNYMMDRNTINRVKQKIGNIPYIELSDEPYFERRDSMLDLIVEIRERKLNQFFASLGILSNAYNTNKLQITGEAVLKLYNIFNKGIFLDINWQKTITSSQFLFFKASYPYILGQPFGISPKFSIENLDSQYVRITTELNLDYYLDYNHSISLTYKNQSSSITIDENEVLSGRLPNYLDYRMHQFGIGYRYTQLDRPIFSRKGIVIEAQSLLGTKDIEINQNIKSLKDANGNSMQRLYDSISLNQTLFSYSFRAESYTPISHKIGLKDIIESKGIFAEDVRVNEMYFFGGNKRPRGFDDNFLIAPWYTSVSHEFQYYISEYFYYNIFADMSIMKRTLQSDFSYPIGFGNGISLKSKGSIINFSVGFGFSESQPFSLSQSKIHFSYVGVF